MQAGNARIAQCLLQLEKLPEDFELPNEKGAA
jgi:hypothetical protein